MRKAAAPALVLACAALVGACGGSSVDEWADQQARRLTEAGVTFPPEQKRNTVIAMTSACVTKERNGDDETFMRIWTSTQPRVSDWLSEADAAKMWRLADKQFCSSIPDGPLGEK